MVISNRGEVADNNGWIGYNDTASNNRVLVTGSSSIWTNSGDLYIGGSGSGNSLVITNGGTVVVTGSSYGIEIGFTGSNNSVLVSGTNADGA